MATQDQAILTQTSNPIGYCRRWDNSEAQYDDYDVFAVSVAGPVKTLWEQAADFLYVGKDSKFEKVGFKAGTAGDYGNFSIRYINAGGPYDITAVTVFTQKFFIAENVPEKFTDGSLFTVSGSTGNDGTYTCDGDATWTGAATQITTVEAFPSAVADGNISLIWTTLSIIQDSTAGFSQDGFLSWNIPSDWGTTEIDGDTVYWIRANPASVATAATMYHLMINMTLDPPIFFDPGDDREREYFTINADIGDIDLTYTGPTYLNIDASWNALSMAELTMLWTWWDKKETIYIEDPAASTPADYSSDAHYSDYTGRLAKMPPKVESPGKFEIGEFMLAFKISAATSISDNLGVT